MDTTLPIANESTLHMKSNEVKIFNYKSSFDFQQRVKPTLHSKFKNIHLDHISI